MLKKSVSHNKFKAQFCFFTLLIKIDCIFPKKIIVFQYAKIGIFCSEIYLPKMAPSGIS